MGTVIGDLLPLAVGVAISPIPIVAAILMLLSADAGKTSTGFGLGWVVGIIVVTGVVVALSGSLSGSGDEQPSTAAAWIKIVLGVLLIALAVKQWLDRADTSVPGWMQAIDEFGFGKATGLGIVLSAVNPKNLLLCLSAGVVIGTSGLSAGGDVAAVVIFTVLAASTVLVPVIGYAVAADKLRGGLDTMKAWLQANNHIVMAIVLLVMGAVVLGKGIGGL
ncbi:GAP family protein [Nocardia cyriacigeorgica]|uniref:GAP family protein n=1 Tax=Nocardia cyriacigeorgica TaxID=135487 RepID=UPI001895B8E9|nr:GAP family protein [Nocardia cyriacigeorgica]MBF6089875.1 GAP family protein [Nocardia cyriacigeorgica]MBF6095120.1 GAP family protein [Nocardia cyriacigeorgica]